MKLSFARCFARAVFFGLVFIAPPFSFAQLSPPDWAQIEAETRQHFQAILRLDTSNPPGNEGLVVEYLKGVLDKEGIETKVFAAQSTNGGSHARDDQFAAVRVFIHKQMLERQALSVAVAVARDGKIIWEEGFGWANREERIAATPHTIYSLASISKPITATGLMMLKERGKFELDRPLNDYRSDAKIKVRLGNPANVTVRRVANH